jgi:dipeptidyl aminopeptidase/acylaminoacyl peptidase
MPDCFADVHGWIVYGGDTPLAEDGIWAVNPAGPGDGDDQIQLSDQQGEEPLGWSSDSTKLLIRRAVPGWQATEDYAHAVDLVVLHADGTETLLTRSTFDVDGSISPDGSTVAYSSYTTEGIYTVDVDGGSPHLLLPRADRRYPGEELPKYPAGLYNPAFSPDGTQIAYFDGMGDWGHSLRVMESDGTNVRVLFDRVDAPAHIEDLVWSPDGQRLAYSGGVDDDNGIWTIGVDGSGLTKLIPDAVNPAWSPDGTRISYQPIHRNEHGAPVGGGRLRIADADGTHVSEFGYGKSGPWNPLPPDR